MTSNLLAALKSNQAKTCTITVNPLIEAAKNGRVDNCERALQEPKIKIDLKDHDGVSPLMHATVGGHIDVVKFLIDKGARVAAKDDVGETPLMKACKEGNIALLRMILDAQIALRKTKTSTSFNDPKSNDQVSATENKRILDAKDDEGITALMKAAERGSQEACRLLIGEGASVDARDDETWNALMWAALSGQQEIVTMLVKEYDQLSDYTTEKGETPLMKAAANGYWSVCEFFIQEGAKVNGHDQDHQTALMWAASQGHDDVVQGLIENEAKVDLQSKIGRTALSYAAQFGRFEAAKILVEKGEIKIDVQDQDGFTPIFFAILAGHVDLVDYLIEKKSPIEQHSKRAETPLMWAAMHQQLDCVSLLLKRDADINKQDENGQTALDHAEGTLNAALVEMLRDAFKRQKAAEE